MVLVRTILAFMYIHTVPKMRLVAFLLINILTPLALGSASDYHDQAVELLEKSPLLDTHIDLPQIIRSLRNLPSNPTLKRG